MNEFEEFETPYDEEEEVILSYLKGERKTDRQIEAELGYEEE